MAPLGRAVIGGLAAATVMTLLVLPSLFAIVQGKADTRSVSLDPEDPDSLYHKKLELRDGEDRRGHDASHDNQPEVVR